MWCRRPRWMPFRPLLEYSRPATRHLGALVVAVAACGSSSASVGAQTAAVALEQQLAYYRDLTYRALVASLPTREPRRYLYDLISRQFSHVGKGLRPALCLA